MSEHVKVLFSEEEVDRVIEEQARKISKDYEGKQIHLVCVLKRRDLCRLHPKIPGVARL